MKKKKTKPRLPPIREWLEKNDLVGWTPTMELRINPGNVPWPLEQKWIRSEMQYAHRWVPIRVQREDEL